MISKALSVVGTLLLAALVVSQWPDIRRYVRIKQMSMGQGHPENVPAQGRAAYER